MSGDREVVAWAYHCHSSERRSPFIIRYERQVDDKFRRYPWIETPLYYGCYPPGLKIEDDQS